MANEQKNEGEAPRETVSRGEVLTLVKDVYDIRTLIKKVYSNRAVIGRRVNLVSTIIGVLFTLVYLAYVVFSGLSDKLSLSFEIVSIVLIAAYAVVLIGIIIAAVSSSKIKTKNLKGFNTFLKVLRYAAKILSLAISIACLVLGITAGGESAAGIAVDTVLIIISILVIIIQGVLLLSGGIGGFVRWLVSPVKRKVRFGAVAIEWYGIITSDEKVKGKSERVSKKYLEDIGAVLDGALIPALGKKYIGNIDADDLTAVLAGLNPELLPVGEGTLKKLFMYACGCGYITENPCDKLNLEGDVSESEPRKKGIKAKLGDVVVKGAKSLFDGFLSPDDE